MNAGKLQQQDRGRAGQSPGFCFSFLPFFFFGALNSSTADCSPRSLLAGQVGREVGRTGAGTGKGHL